MDLSEWRGTRVLALRDARYYPGVIRNASLGEVFVEFDGEGTLVRYTGVLGCRRFDVIGDATPSLGQLTIDAKVCLKCPMASGHIDAMTNVFVRGIVAKIVPEHKRFVVKIPMEGDRSESYVVKRADLRLLQPPWVDELEEGIEEIEPARTDAVGKLYFQCFAKTNYNHLVFQWTKFGHFLCAAAGYRGTLEGSSSIPFLYSPLPLTSLMPHHHHDSGGYYRTTGTSPLPTTTIQQQQQQQNSTVAMSNGNRTFDDMESDDDLGREDITFPSDAGN